MQVASITVLVSVLFSKGSGQEGLEEVFETGDRGGEDGCADLNGCPIVPSKWEILK